MSTWDSLSLSDRSTALGSIDNKLYQIFISSENNSRKNSIVLAPNSPGLSTLGTTQKFWFKVVHCKQHCFKDHTYLCKTTQSLGIRSFHIPLEDTIHNLKSKNKVFLNTTKSHLQLRDLRTAEDTELHKDLLVQKFREKLKAKWRKYIFLEKEDLIQSRQWSAFLEVL